MPNLYFNDWPQYSPHDQNRRENVVAAAKLMVNAAMTAPNAGGVSQIEAHLVWGYEEQEAIARQMEQLSGEFTHMARPFKYEAVLVRDSDAILLLGDTRAADSPMDAECGACGGKPDCSFVYERRPGALGLIDWSVRNEKSMADGPTCIVRDQDFGYAMGSALWMANRLMVDARPFMTVGVAARRLGYCRNSPLAIGILVAALAKNPYVDLNPDYHLVNLNKLLDSTRREYALLRQVGPDWRISDPAARKEAEDRRKADRKRKVEEKKHAAEAGNPGARATPTGDKKPGEEG